MAFTNFQHQCTANFKIHDYSRATPALKEALKDLPRLAALASHETGFPIKGTIDIRIFHPEDMRKERKRNLNQILSKNLTPSDNKFVKRSELIRRLLLGANKGFYAYGETKDKNTLLLNTTPKNTPDIELEFKKTIFHEFVHIGQLQNTSCSQHQENVVSAAIRSRARHAHNHPATEKLHQTGGTIKCYIEGHARYYENKVLYEGKLGSSGQYTTRPMQQVPKLRLVDQIRDKFHLYQEQFGDFYSIGELEIKKIINENSDKAPKAVLLDKLNTDFSSGVQAEIDHSNMEPRGKNHIAHTLHYLDIVTSFIRDAYKGYKQF